MLMRTLVTLIVLSVGFLFFFNCMAINSSGRSDGNGSKEENGPLPLEKGGGLEEIAADSTEAREAFLFLKEELRQTNPEIVLLEIVQAFHQVAAGYNTVLICTYKKKVQSVERRLFARVYTNLKNEKQLTQIEMNYSR
jgi:hypothetical protein